MVAPFIRGVGRIAASGFDFPTPLFLRRAASEGIPAAPVESVLPGVRRARPVADPQDVQFINPRLGTPEAPPIRILPPELMPGYVPPPVPAARAVEPYTIASERYTDIINPIVPGRSPAQVRYMPLPPDEAARITRYAEEDPFSAILDAVNAIEDAANPEQFAVALQAVRAVRRGAPESDIFAPMQRTLDNTINRRAVELGIPQDVIDELPLISNAARPRGLFKESRDLADKGFDAQEQNAWPFLQSLRKQKKNLAKSSPSESDFNTVGALIFGQAGGQILRMVRSGDIGLTHARRLHDEAVDLYLDMLKADLGAVVRGKGLRALKGENLAKMSEEGRTRMYGFAMQSADTPDEVSAISALWRNDIKNPNFFDELDMLEGHAVERLNSFARVDPWTAKPRARATIDEQSITEANVAQRDFDARRATSDDTRPSFPSDDASPDDTIVRRTYRNEQGELVEEVTGGGRSRLISGEDIARERLYPEPKNKNPWKMTFADRPSHPMKPAFQGESTMDLVFSGDRTATTRATNYNVDVGDVIDFADDAGRIARVRVTKAPYQLPQPLSADHRNRLAARWSELEGWDPSLYDEYIGQWQFQYELIGEVKGPRFLASAPVPGKGKSWGQFSDGAESFEVSTKGTQQGRQYSAFNARIKGRGNKSIEDIYQIDIKGGEKLAPGRYSMKGKLPEGMTPDEAYETYKNLWREWFQENPRKLQEISELTQGKKITDQYASSNVSQARAIYEILVESGLWRGLT